MDVLVTGATGVLGRSLVSPLQEDGYRVLAASRSPPPDGDVSWTTLDLVTGAGIETAVTEADIVLHAASDPFGDTTAVDERGTERLLAAAETAGLDRFVYVSIVGVDEIPYSYYQSKRRAELATEAADVPSTIVRSTQFHGFIAALLDRISRIPIWPLPTDFEIQPIDSVEAAAAIVDHLDSGGTIDIGGPEVRTVRALATAYRSVRELRRPIIRLPIPGAIAGAFRDGHALCPNDTVGTVTWEEWLQRQPGIPGRGVY